MRTRGSGDFGLKAGVPLTAIDKQVLYVVLSCGGIGAALQLTIA
jgi:hypothetical protein